MSVLKEEYGIDSVEMLMVALKESEGIDLGIFKTPVRTDGGMLDENSDVYTA